MPLEPVALSDLGGTAHRLRVRYATPDGPVGGSVYLHRLGDPASPVKLLLLHGVGSTHACWIRVLPALARLADCAAIDMLGHGRSEADDIRRVNLSTQTWLIPEVLDALGWSDVILCGHSMGGGASLGAALSWPERIAGLVLVASVAYPQPVPAQFWPLYLPGAALGLSAVNRLGLRFGADAIMARDLGYDPRSARDYLAALADRRQAAACVRAVRNLRPSTYRRYGRYWHLVPQPALVIHGRRDSFVPAAVAERLIDTLPDCRALWLPRADHIPQETHADQVTGAMTSFLRERFAAQSRVDESVEPAHS